jgi:Xaa-Pro aminopeptidase
MYRRHRTNLIEKLVGLRAAAVVFTATEKVRNHDSHYRFRPDSDFWYLTGFAEPESVLVLLPDGGRDDQPRSILFLRESDREREIWDGRRLGVPAAPAELGVDEARPIGRLWDDLVELLANQERIVYRTGQCEDRDRRMLQTLSRLRGKARGGVVPPTELLDVAPLVHELRLFKDNDELTRMRRAADLTREAHLAAMRAAAPGVNEREIDALLDYTFRSGGGTGAAYSNIVAGGANACILHYHENDQPLRDGDLLLIDAGAEFEYYAGDVTRTFPVNGTFSAEQRAIYQIVLDAQLAALGAVRPGMPFDAYHQAALETIIDGLVALGLLRGDRDTILAEGSYRRFFMHRTGHWLGLDVHDCGAYVQDGGPRALAPGMVLTVEPGIYISPDDDQVEPRWRGIGVRIEDDVLVTVDGCEVLTAAIPKTIDEVEAACRGAHLEPVA